MSAGAGCPNALAEADRGEHMNDRSSSSDSAVATTRRVSEMQHARRLRLSVRPIAMGVHDSLLGIDTASLPLASEHRDHGPARATPGQSQARGVTSRELSVDGALTKLHPI